MPSLRIRPADAENDVELLLAFSARLHVNDRSYVPPLRWLEARRIRQFMAAERLVLFLAERDGEVVGTISALRDEGYEKHSGQAVCWFGYFEALKDDTVVEALLAAVRHQARRWDCDKLRGPRNLTRFESVGLTVEGHHRLPPMLQGHHPPHYAEMLENAGLEKHHDIYAYETDLHNPDGSPKPLPEKLAQASARCDLPNLTVRATSWSKMSRDLVAAHEVLNAAYATVPDTSPMPLKTWLALGRTYLTMADVRLLQIAYDGDRPVAFAACLPDIASAQQSMDGSLRPGRILAGLLSLRVNRTAGFKLIGVLPEYRGTGVHARLIEHVVEGLRAAGYTRLDGSVIDERNKPMRAVVEGAGLRVFRTYRFFGGSV